ncbi:MAG: HAMP domain-containing sensor histidine kinase [Pseudomonadota bacterium]
MTVMQRLRQLFGDAQNAAAGLKTPGFLRSASLSGELTRWSLLLLAVGLIAALAVGELAKRSSARSFADFSMIDFVREEIKPALALCQGDNMRCLAEVAQNEGGGVWAVVDATGEQRQSFTFAVSEFANGTRGCTQEAPRTVRSFEIFTCENMGDGVSYRVARRMTADAEELVALETILWEQRVARAADRLVGWGNLRWALGAMAGTLIALLALNLVLTRRRLSWHFEGLRAELEAFREGRAAKIAGAYPTEIQTLVDSLNRALEKNAGLVERQKRNVNKMAHDLRHQLVNIDVAARETQTTSEDPEQEALRGELTTLNQLVERYLTLVDWVGPTEGQKEVQIHGALETVRKVFMRRFRAHAPDTSLEIEIDCPETLTAKIHPTDLKIILNNLMTNAHKYARTRARLSAKPAENGALWVSVEDDGPGVPAEDRAKILDWGSRLDDRLPGSGFGLTIVAEQVRELYGGDVHLGDSALGGLSATVKLPKAVKA